MRIYWQLIVDYFDYMAEHRPNMLLTFARTVSDIATRYNLPLQNVEAAFSLMLEKGWFTKKRHVCKCQRKSEPGAHEKVSHKRPRKSEPERSRIVEPVC